MAPLSARQLEKFRSMLSKRSEALRAEIHAEMIRAGNETFADLVGGVADAGDEAVATVIADMDQALAGRQLAELRQIEEAQRRLDSGEYGVCVDCEDDIEEKRLAAYPSAKRCVLCQGKYEKTYAQGGKPTL